MADRPSGTGANNGWWPVLWFLGKVLVLLFVFIWLRGTLPRLRYDQFMKLGWKVLIPVSMVWILAGRDRPGARASTPADARAATLLVGGAPLLVIVAGRSSPRGRRLPRPPARRSEAASRASPPEFDPMAGGYPVPPLPGQTLAADAAPAAAVSQASRQPSTADGRPGRWQGARRTS